MEQDVDETQDEGTASHVFDGQPAGSLVSSSLSAIPPTADVSAVLSLPSPSVISPTPVVSTIPDPVDDSQPLVGRAPLPADLAVMLAEAEDNETRNAFKKHLEDEQEWHTAKGKRSSRSHSRGSSSKVRKKTSISPPSSSKMKLNRPGANPSVEWTDASSMENLSNI